MMDILPEHLNSIKGLELLSKKILEGQKQGKSPSRKRGFGQTFSQYRNYEPGDDLRLLDWKVLAKTDRYYVKESEISSTISIQCLIDASASMNYQEEKWSKLNYARLLCAVLGRLGKNQGDQLQLHVFQKEKKRIPQKQNWSLFLHYLSKVKGGAINPLDFQIPSPSKKEKSLFLIFTDLYQVQEEWLEFLKASAGPRKEIILFHLSGEKERSLNFKGNLTFLDLETKEKMNLNAKKTREQYQSSWEAWVNQWKSFCLSSAIHYVPTPLGEPPAQFLPDFLKRRKNLIS